MLQTKYQTGLALFILTAAVLLYYAEIITFQAAWLGGDYRLFHFPFLNFHAERIKDWHLPLWNSWIQSGFPTFSEGQTGVIYPVSLILHFLLPPLKAYSYEILGHFIFGGMVFYSYLRSKKLAHASALFASVMYLFCVTQGGFAAHNFLSQRALVWMPLALLCMDQMVSKRNLKDAIFLGMIFSFQIFAGNIQHAVYAIGVSLLYAVSAIFVDWKRGLHPTGGHRHSAWLGLSLALLLTGVIALPQLLGTMELSRLTGRWGAAESFAYQGSVHPAAFLTMLYPHWFYFLRTEFYLGVLPIFFIFIVIFGSNKKWEERFFLVLAVLAIGAALGSFNPLYVLFIKLTHLTSFRIPSKFLYFAGFSFSVLAAYGFDRWLNTSAWELRKAHLSYQGFCALGLAALLAGYFMLRFAAPLFKSQLTQYVTWFFSTANFHTLEVQHYLNSWDALVQKMAGRLSPFSPWNACFAGCILISQVWVMGLMRQNKWPVQVKVWGSILLLFINLYAYGWVGIKRDYGPHASPYKSSPIIDHLKNLDQNYRVHLLHDKVPDTSEPPLVVQDTMIHHMATPQAYSSLLVKDYYELFEGIGGIDDADQPLLPDWRVWAQRSSLLDFLAVKYLVSNKKLENLPYVELPIRDGNYRVYENPNVLPRAFFVSRAVAADQQGFKRLLQSGQFQPTRRVYLADLALPVKDESGPEIFLPADSIRNEHERVMISIRVPSAGYLVLSDLDYPGWKVKVNGQRDKILRANGAFRAVHLARPGSYQIQFDYEPFWKKWIPVSLVLMVGGILFCILEFLRLKILNKKSVR